MGEMRRAVQEWRPAASTNHVEGNSPFEKAYIGTDFAEPMGFFYVW